MKFKLFPAALLIGASFVSIAARADLYSADAAYKAQDFPHAFELYRELAELGQVEAQKNLASMYVSGEGVKRDNVLGYAWAVIAKENGGGAEVQPIIDQLESHLNDNAHARIAEVQAQFGKAALEKRLLPTPYVASPASKTPASRCNMARPVDPELYWPREAKQSGIAGTVLIEATIAPDGRARNPRAVYSLPARVFEEAGRRVALDNGYSPSRENGVAVSCTILFKVRFSFRPESATAGSSEVAKDMPSIRSKAQGGDPRSQLLYGLLLEMRPALNRDHEDVVGWYIKAAQAGVAQAQYMAGTFTFNSDADAKPDDNKGVRWWALASADGDPDAQVALANYLLRGKPDDATVAKAVQLLEKAAAADFHPAKFYLAAQLAASPDATRRDPKRALTLLEPVMHEFDSDPAAFEIRAAANAMLGEFASAQKDQKIALGMAKHLGWKPTVQQERLDAYQANKSWTGDPLSY